MPKNAGPSSSKRYLLASVSSSILRYGGPAWVPALETKQNQKKLSSTFRLMVMQVVSAYRNMSSEAVCVIAGMIPIGITLAEDRVEHGGERRMDTSTNTDSFNLGDQKTWRSQLPPNGVPVCPRLLQEIPASVRTRSVTLCPECGNVDETPEHEVFDCPKFEAV
ncbi:uncharacterized protein LOC135714014 [Ochlerotatus camptorhynchus]|uniref:uncharacterized protein LOC135714014 n=1 Tax=Ochlerotatus camptorhynchus TaxID=644619 RepID=UPI0031D2AAF5